MKFKAVTNDRRQIELNWDAINVYLSRYKPGTPIDVEITRKVKRKSDPMRKYYFAVVLPLYGEHAGYDPEEYLDLHKMAKARFYEAQPKKLEELGLPAVYKDKKGIYRNIPHVFADESLLPVSEKSRYIEWFARKASMEGVYIPSPGEKND